MSTARGRARIAQALERAEKIAAEAERERSAIAESARLSDEGVMLALDQTLERTSTAEGLDAMVANSAPAERVTLVLSAGVFTAAFRAVLLALASSPHVVVRPSRRDPVFARIVVRVLGDLGVTIDEALAPETVTSGVLHVYGRNETIDAIAARARVPIIGKGAGFGVAFIAADANLVEAAADAALVITLFDQRGCLSPRAAFVEGTTERANAFAAELDRALTMSNVPRGPLSDEERADHVRFAEEGTFAGVARESREHVVCAFSEPRFRLSPVGRAMSVLPVLNPSAMHASLAPYARFVTTFGVAGAVDDIRGDIGHARVTPLRAMQSPPLDGPADLRPPRTKTRS